MDPRSFKEGYHSSIFDGYDKITEKTTFLDIRYAYRKMNNTID